MKRRSLRVALVFVAVLLATYAFVSFDRCGPDAPAGPELSTVVRGRGALQFGAARAELNFPFPVVVGGYGPVRPTAEKANVPLFARASVVTVGAQKFALVSLDALLISDELVEHVRTTFPFPVWVAATHTHSGAGAFDRRLAAELAGLGSFRHDVAQTLTTAVDTAILDAQKSLKPAFIERRESTTTHVRARSGNESDSRLAEVRFVTPTGDVLGHWVLLSAHPTLVARGTNALDPDYPGRLSTLLEADGSVALVLQSAGGNASATAASPDEMAAAIAEELKGGSWSAPVTESEIAYAETNVLLPSPDASRVTNALFAPAVRNVLCKDMVRSTKIAVIRIGELSLVSVPGEPSRVAGDVLTLMSGAWRVVSLTNGYVGYIESVEAARTATGESRRQYFPPDFLTMLADGARLSGQAAGTLAQQK